MTTTTSHRVPHPAPLSKMTFWERSFEERDEVFDELRRTAPVTWHPPLDSSMEVNSDGFWAVVRHEDITAVSADSETYSSSAEYGGVMFEDLPEFFADATGAFLVQDDPRHAKMRKLVSVAFTPKRLRAFQEAIDKRSVEIVDNLINKGDCDFVYNVAQLMPMWAISELMGIPEELREGVAHWADVQATGGHGSHLTGGMDPGEAVLASLGYMRGAGLMLAEMRRWLPADDLMSGLIAAEIDGEKLSDNDIVTFFNLLGVAGNDTTRNTLAHAVLGLTNNPEQRAYLLEDFDGRIDGAIEEFLRWGTVVETFRRTATTDTELNGQKIAKGEKVVMFYGSGNRDPEMFDEPGKFDLSRTPNKHMAFGGGGSHFCMGSMLAKAEMKSLMKELLTRVPNIEASDPKMASNVFMRTIIEMPCKLNL